MTTPNWRTVVDLVATIVMGTAAMMLVWHTFVTSDVSKARGQSPIEDVSAAELSTTVSGLSTVGSARAPLVMIEFSDFECPYCARYVAQTWNQIRSDFIATGKLLYAVRNLPLERNHPNAIAAAKAAECAATQDRFWEMRSRLHADRAILSTASWFDEASRLKLDVPVFAACLGEQSIEAKIRDDVSEGRRLGVNATPTFVIGNRSASGEVRVELRIAGAHPYATFQKAIEMISHSN
jgi:protein-disulfide isomerase